MSGVNATKRNDEEFDVFETGIRQFRMAMGMVWGRKMDPGNIARRVDDALATLAEFGEAGVGVRELVDGPFADPDERAELAERGVRRTATRLAEMSPFYARRFAAAGIHARRLDMTRLGQIPVTVKRELIEQRREFWCSDVPPHLATRTTGTTGPAAEVWMSRYELELWSAMSALTGVLRDEIRPTDMIQVHVSSRATAAVHLTAAICRLVGAGCRVLGVVPPDEALDYLTGATLMSASPSYVAELVVAARRRGLTAADFRLRRIDSGGEILSSTLRAAAAETFGARINDAFGMTEVVPVSATACSHGHLHHDLNVGLVELLDLASGKPAAPGSLASVVITPYTRSGSASPSSGTTPAMSSACWMTARWTARSPACRAPARSSARPIRSSDWRPGLSSRPEISSKRSMRCRASRGRPASGPSPPVTGSG
jgi:hypothetical protein